jgi:hypothetical protein
VIRPGNLPECIGALLFLGIGFLVMREGYRMQAYAASVFVGDHTFPVILGTVSCVLSSLLLLQSWRQPKEARTDAARATANRVPLFLCLLLLLLYAGLILLVSYVPATFLVSAGLFRLFGGYRWHKAVLFAAVLTGCQYVLFDVWMKIPFPAGWLF